MPKIPGDRKTLYEYFRCYRLCKLVLEREMVPHGAQPKSKRGYASATDPDLIHVFPVHPRSPSSSGRPMLSSEEARWGSFVDWIDRKVQRLTACQRDIVRMRYLCEEPLPSDEEVLLALHSNWRTYHRQKSQAMSRLSKSLNAIHALEN